MSNRRLLIVAITTFLTLNQLVHERVLADQILQIHNESLTTYVQTPDSAHSGAQDVRPQASGRGVHLDGSLRAPPLLPMALAGNPFGETWNSNSTLAGVRLDTGTYTINDVDLSLPGPGFSWVIGRTYNCRQADDNGHFDSDGFQGVNWFQTSAPEIAFGDGASDDEDVIYLLYGADRYVEFKRFDATSNEFHGVNGAAGALAFTAGASTAPDTYTYTDQHGNQLVFFGFDSDSTPAKGRLWKVIDPAGNTAYAGDPTTGATAISSGFNGSGWVTTVYQPLTAGVTRRFTYAYSNGRLDSVTVAEKPSVGSYTNTGALVEYFYYGSEDYGEPGDLKRVKITTPLTDSGVTLVRTKYYRYYEDAYDDSDSPGYDHQIRYIYDFEGVRQFDWIDTDLTDTAADLDAPSLDDLMPYASAYFSYYEDVADVKVDRRIKSAWFNGSCGCGGGGAGGTHQFRYVRPDTIDDDPGYDSDQTWALRTEVELPGQVVNGTTPFSWQYFDEVGQPLHRVMAGDNAPAVGDPIWRVVRNAAGQIIEIDDPTNVDTYVHATDGSFDIDSDTTDGLVTLFTRVTTGDTTGFIESALHSEGSGGTAHLDLFNSYTTRDLVVGDVELSRPLISTTHVFAGSETTDTNYIETAYSYGFHSGTNTNVLYLAPKQITTTLPAVSSSKNGSGSSNTRKQYIRTDGTIAFVEEENGIFSHSLYTNGQLVKSVQDANTTLSYDVDPNGTFGITEVNVGTQWVIEYAYDSQGRLDTTSPPGGRVLKNYYSKLGDGRIVTLHYNDFEATPKFYGPVQYTVTNLAGRSEINATIALTDSIAALTAHVDEADDDPITAIDLGPVAQMTATLHDKTGNRVEESRMYFAIPLTFPGVDGTDYDATTYGYAASGQVQRTLDATGTIRWTLYTPFGQVEEQYLGTDDATGVNPAYMNGNMSNVTNATYTTNLQLSSRELVGSGYSGGALGDGDTASHYDFRGRQIVRMNPTAPHEVFAYDNLNRVTAVGLYTAISSPSATCVPTTTTDRVGYTEYAYDEMGRVWKTTRHKVDQSSGSSSDSLDLLRWYDPLGRVIKEDGPDLVKTRFDRLGRVTHRYVLASHNDASNTYSDVYDSTNKRVDVAGDIILEEHQTTFDATDGNAIMTATIDRFHSDAGGGETTGALDTNADNDDLLYTAANVKGRIQITANWYDRFDRLTETVNYGTNGGSNFDRDALSVPSRSPTALLTEYTFNTDGTLLQVADPKNLKTRYTYDAAGRQTLVINNYVNGSPSALTADDDALTKYTYTDGLLTELRVDIYPAGNGSEDEVTEYHYGVTKTTTGSAGVGPDSWIAAGHLLRETEYPDSEVVQFAYGAQGQQVWMEDQTGTEIVTEYQPGRVSDRLVMALGTNIDGAVRRIEYTFDGLGRRLLVTQYDDWDGTGVATDEVKFTYDNWGPVSLIEQDHDSIIGGSGVSEYEVGYSYAKAGSGTENGRNTIRRSGMTYPNSSTLTFVYTGSTLHDDWASRVSNVTFGANKSDAASYSYNGVGQVVGTTIASVDVYSRRHSSTPGAYPGLDNFNRVVVDTWTKDLSTDRDFYSLDVTYDENSNIPRTEDNIFVRKDVVYTMDNLNRLTDAQWGTYSGGSIISEYRQRTWTIDQVGNWRYDKLDLNNDNAFGGAGERNEDRTHNTVNELLGRDTDDNGTDNFTLVYNDAGDLTDDGENYEYVYDAFHRLKEVRRTDNQNLVAEYRYNGLGQRITWHYDTDADGDVDGSDKTYHFVYDDQWRIIATYRDSDGTPKERFVYHNAGADGLGSSSYIDSAVFRDRDMTSGWTGSVDGTLEQRTYYCQNWRADVVALISATGGQVQQIRYGEYGEAFGLPRGDTDGDGDVNNGDTADSDQIQAWISGSVYDVRGDLDLDGDVQADDKTAAIAMAGTVLGWGNLSLSVASSGGGNRKGYAGYENDGVLTGSQFYHVRNRVYHVGLARWLMRDPMGYRSGKNLYRYCDVGPLSNQDPFGLEGFAFGRPVVFATAPGGGMCDFMQEPTRRMGLQDAPQAQGISTDGGSAFVSPIHHPPGDVSDIPDRAMDFCERECNGNPACLQGCSVGASAEQCRTGCSALFPPGSQSWEKCVLSCRSYRGGLSPIHCDALNASCLQVADKWCDQCHDMAGGAATYVGWFFVAAGGITAMAGATTCWTGIGVGVAVGGFALTTIGESMLEDSCEPLCNDLNARCNCMHEECLGERAKNSCGAWRRRAPDPWSSQ